MGTYTFGSRSHYFSKNLKTLHFNLIEQNNLAGDDQFCLLCKLSFTHLESIITDKKIEALIIKGLKVVCGYLPDVYAATCKLLVPTYIPVLIDAIVQEATPKKICQYLGLCKKPADVLNIKPLKCEPKGARCNLVKVCCPSLHCTLHPMHFYGRCVPDEKVFTYYPSLVPRLTHI